MQTQIIIRPPDSNGYNSELGFSIGGLVKSVGSAVKSVASSSVGAVSSAAHAVGSGVKSVAKTGVTLVSKVAKLSCGTVQVANRAAPIAMSVPNPYVAAGGALTAATARVCNMAYPPPPSPAAAPTSDVDAYAEAVPAPIALNVGPTAPDPVVVSASYPPGTIYTRDARRPGAYRVAVPVRALAGLGAAPTHAEVASTAEPPAGATEVTSSQFATQTGRGGILRDYRFWLAVGGAVAAGGATAVHLHRRRQR